MHSLIAAGLRCPACRSALEPTGAGIVCRCGLRRDLDAGAIDLTVAAPAPPELTMAPAAGAAIAALGLPNTDDVRRAVTVALGPVPRTGNAFFDAEEDILLDRFGLENFEPSVALGPAYPPSRAAAGQTFMVALRVRNTSLFPLSSTASPPLVLSYHWLDRGETVVFEGIRSALPIKLPAGAEVTALVNVLAPPRPGPYTLRLHAIHEGVARLDSQIDVMIEIGSSETAPPDTRKGVPFNEHEDGQIGAAFVADHLTPSGTIVEIGGGVRPLFYDAYPDPTPATFINMDASMRQLRLAQVIRTRPDGWMVRADATQIPVEDGALDAVIFCRALHHFPDLQAQMTEVFRALKPGGALFLICEPVGSAYDEPTCELIRAGVNEQVFPLGAYERMAAAAGFLIGPRQLDWGMSFKGKFMKPATGAA